MVMDKPTNEWELRQNGINYKHKLDLYGTVDKNERFYAGDQWAGIKVKGLDTPVFNIFKRVINWLIAAIMSYNIKLQFVPELVGDEPQDDNERKTMRFAELITAYSDVLWEKLQMTKNLRQALLDAALSGDACAYVFWDKDIDTGQPVKGDISLELVDNVNVYFGNPNDPRVNFNGKPVQPYILLEFRELVSKLKAEAQKYGVPKDKIALITSDESTETRSGDRGKIEIDGKSDEEAKATVLIKLWYDEDKKTIMARKSTKFVVVRPDWDTKLKIYPVAWMNWDKRKNSCHGQAVGTGLIPNQIFINKAFAMVMLWVRSMAIPKVLFDKSVITSWSNKIGAAIGVDGPVSEAVARYMTPSQISDMVIKSIDLAIKYTKDLMGASDAALGDVKPENTSAIIAVQQATAIPLENVRQNLYQFVEDIGYIWLDFMSAYYGERKVRIDVLGRKVVQEVDFDDLRKMKLRLKIEVGPSSYWSEIMSVRTLDNLLAAGKLDIVQYLERLPNGLIPRKQELIEQISAADTRRQFTYEMMARYMEQLPQETRDELNALPPEAMERRVMDMMLNQPQTTIPQPQVMPQSTMLNPEGGVINAA